MKDKILMIDYLNIKGNNKDYLDFFEEYTELNKQYTVKFELAINPPSERVNINKHEIEDGLRCLKRTLNFKFE